MATNNHQWTNIHLMDYLPMECLRTHFHQIYELIPLEECPNSILDLHKDHHKGTSSKGSSPFPTAIHTTTSKRHSLHRTRANIMVSISPIIKDLHPISSIINLLQVFLLTMSPAFSMLHL